MEKQDLIELREDSMWGKKPDLPETFILFPNECIGGGAIRRWFQKEPNHKDSDIDLFYITTEEPHLEGNMQKRIAYFVENNYKRNETKNAITFSDERYKFQIIKKDFDSWKSIIEQFDFKCCQFLWVPSDEGLKILSKPDAVMSTARKHLALNQMNKGFEVDTLRRAFKYYAQGFKPCMGTFRDIALGLGMSAEDVNKQIEFSPGGGKRVIRFD